MDYSQFTVADLYAIKSEAKEKEAYYRTLKIVSQDYLDDQKQWSDILYHADKELTKRLIPQQ